VVQISEYTANLSTVVVVPLTKNKGRTALPGTVLIQRSAENGLDFDSVALVHQVRVIDKQRVRNQRGCLSDTDLATIDKELALLLGL
jgi:mRNA interferase MazF